ncbi:MAG: sigma-70 family RNA polymerase sigma factor [Limisphaerales bacterium]
MSPPAPAADAALLRRYAEQGAEEAFAELVRRHIGLVHAAARRQVPGEAAAADVTQAVFTELARQARRLARHPALAGWLHTTTRHLAARHVRGETRRQRREQEAHAMQQIARDEAPDTAWDRVGPVLDAAMHGLGETDRLVVLLRCFERRPFAEVGARLGLSENAARMRADRALDRLRSHLARRGITSTATALALALGGSAVATVPAALTANVTAGALAGAAGSTLGILTLMASTKLKSAVAAILVVGTGTALVVQHQAGEQLRRDSAGLRVELARLSADADAARQAAADAAQRADASRPGDELLALRGEVGRLRRELARSAARPSPAPAAPALVTPAPEPAAEPFTASVQAVMPPGHTLVAGGWEWSDGRRGLLLITPTAQVSADGGEIVEIEHKTVLVPDALLDELGLGALRTGDAAADAQGVLEPERAEALLKAFEDRGGVEILASPRITTANGRQAGIGLTGDDIPYAITFDVTPTVNADGQIDLTAEGRAERRPPVPGR